MSTAEYRSDFQSNLSAPVVSIILPTYNRAHLLKRAVRSVLLQGFQDWELIIVDDGSTDETPEVLRSFEAIISSQLKIISRPHEGVSAARNAGLNNARGKYIAFLDSDDYWLPDKLRAQISFMEEDPDCGLCFSDFLTLEDDGTFNDAPRIAHETGREIKYPFLLTVRNNFVMTPCVVARRDVIEKVGCFDLDLDICEDVDLWHRVSEISKCCPVYQQSTVIRTRGHAEFPYGESFCGRHKLYSRALDRDASLSAKFIKGLYREIAETYFSVACERNDTIIARLFQTALRKLTSDDLLDREKIASIAETLLGELAAECEIEPRFVRNGSFPSAMSA